MVLAGVLLPFSPLASLLGFVPWPAGFLIFLVLATVGYLSIVEFVKRRLARALISPRRGTNGGHLGRRGKTRRETTIAPRSRRIREAQTAKPVAAGRA